MYLSRKEQYTYLVREHISRQVRQIRLKSHHVVDNDIDHDHDQDHDHSARTRDHDPGEDAADAGDPIEDTSNGLPTPAQLRADWAYLAAVRVVVEANLHEAFADSSDMRGLLALDGLRPGSAPWDASAYKPSEVEPPAACVKGKAKESVEVTGWDWAGMTGMWKRCVCWMDYRDLICTFSSSRLPELG